MLLSLGLQIKEVTVYLAVDFLLLDLSFLFAGALLTKEQTDRENTVACGESPTAWSCADFLLRGCPVAGHSSLSLCNGRFS